MPKQSEQKKWLDSEKNELEIGDILTTINDEERNKGTRKDNPELDFCRKDNIGKIFYLPNPPNVSNSSAVVIFDKDPKKRKLTCLTKNLLKRLL